MDGTARGLHLPADRETPEGARLRVRPAGGRFARDLVQPPHPTGTPPSPTIRATSPRAPCGRLSGRPGSRRTSSWTPAEAAPARGPSATLAAVSMRRSCRRAARPNRVERRGRIRTRFRRTRRATQLCRTGALLPDVRRNLREFLVGPPDMRQVQVAIALARRKRLSFRLTGGASDPAMRRGRDRHRGFRDREVARTGVFEGYAEAGNAVVAGVAAGMAAADRATAPDGGQWRLAHAFGIEDGRGGRSSMETVEWSDFERVEIRVGRVVSAERVDRRPRRGRRFRDPRRVVDVSPVLPHRGARYRRPQHGGRRRRDSLRFRGRRPGAAGRTQRRGPRAPGFFGRRHPYPQDRVPAAVHRGGHAFGKDGGRRPDLRRQRAGDGDRFAHPRRAARALSALPERCGLGSGSSPAPATCPRG